MAGWKTSDPVITFCKKPHRGEYLGGAIRARQRTDGSRQNALSPYFFSGLHCDIHVRRRALGGSANPNANRRRLISGYSFPRTADLRSASPIRSEFSSERREQTYGLGRHRIIELTHGTSGIVLIPNRKKGRATCLCFGLNQASATDDLSSCAIIGGALGFYVRRWSLLTRSKSLRNLPKPSSIDLAPPRHGSRRPLAIPDSSKTPRNERAIITLRRVANLPMCNMLNAFRAGAKPDIDSKSQSAIWLFRAP